ncbi:1-acyl-sn-glycerol-3-phosphate acyltransferase [Agromyces sp. SYSU T00194]|uniref:1-acyl-sn-glycerol-3-phosphate acyltransferase n=1 Tax=Agromyces chitinivorans TaxID=3158560 RepID=UPI00339B43BE
MIAPLVVVLALGLTLTLPVWLVLAVIASLIMGWRFRIPRILWMLDVYLLWEAAALIGLLGLWIASGFGWRMHRPPMQHAHYRFVARMLRFLFWNAHWALRLDIEVRVPPGFHDDARPAVIASRHAGPADSFILIHAVLNWFDRSPRIVMKDTMQWDPAVDVVLNRLPNRFIAPPPLHAVNRREDTDVIARIRELATGMGSGDAFVIFPEGGNFTPERRARAIERLHAAGLHAAAERASRMMHVMAPRPAGLFAALDGAPDADVFFVAHTGLDRIRSIGDVWKELPTDTAIVMRFWTVSRSRIPVDHDERLEWLMDEWEAIDRWIDRARTE